MDSTLLAIILLILGLAAGAAAGWFMGSRPAADWRNRFEEKEAQAKDLDDKFKRAGAELGQSQIELGDAKVEIATLKANEANFDKQMHQMKEAREEMLAQFKATGAEVLQRNQEDFLKRAEQRFKQSEEAGEAKIKTLLNPVGERLEKYEKQVETLEKQRVDAFGQLTGLIATMRDGQEEVRREAQRLGNSLTNAPKARGRWGEQQLKNVLEQVGLAEHTDFQLEASIETDEGARLRPDAIVRIPGGKVLVIDAKVSLNAYQQAFEADEDAARDAALADHVRSMRNHVTQLGAKSYQSQFEDAPDYVVMFVPGEHFVAAALEADPSLWDFAFDKRVLLATPTNLVAIARTVAQVWRQDGLAKEAQEIGRIGAELYDRLRVSAEHLKRVGGGLESAVNNYNKFVGSYERNVLSSGKRLADKGVEIGKAEIAEVPLVEAAPRYNADDAIASDAAEMDLIENQSEAEAPKPAKTS
ncbi:MAG: DNA recombination protein RmuC [Erythrobacter sp.]